MRARRRQPAAPSSGRARCCTMPSHDGREPVVLLRRVARDRAHDRHIVVLEPAAETVGHQLFREASGRTGPGCFMMAAAEGHRAVHVAAVGQLARSGRWRRPAPSPATRRCRRSSPARSRAGPSPGGSWRTPGCGGAAPGARAATSAPARPRCPRAPARSAGGAGGGVPRMFSRMYLPRSTGDVRFGYDVTVSTLPWPSRPRRAGLVSVDAAEVAAVDVRHAVVPRQPLVDERVVGVEQVEHAAVLRDDALEEQLRFLAERLPQLVVEVREVARRRHVALQVAQQQPLAGEVVGERPRLRVGEHAHDLPLERRPAWLRRPLRGQRRAARRRGSSSRGRTTAATRARGR